MMTFKITFWIVVAISLIGFTVARITTRQVESSAQSPQQQPAQPTERPLQICEKSTPCKWAIYKKGLSKEIEYYIKNVCECDNNRVCAKAHDDISVSAFVYQCFPKQ